MTVFQQPFFVTPHAIQRYRERVDHRASDREIVEAVQSGIQVMAPMYPPNRTIAIGNRGGGRFVAIVEPPSPEHGEWPQVVTIWGWDRCPIMLKKKGPGGTRRYRWLNKEFVGEKIDSADPDRVSVLRAEVRRLAELIRSQDASPEVLTEAAEVMFGWLS